MEKKFFTIDEVNQLIPQIEYHFRKLIEDKGEMGKASRRLGKLGFSPQGALAGEIPRGADDEARGLAEIMQSHYQSFKNHALAIEALGGRIKDLELGRVEFLSRQGEKIVALIWQLGVTDSVHAEDADASVVRL